MKAAAKEVAKGNVKDTKPVTANNKVKLEEELGQKHPETLGLA